MKTIVDAYGGDYSPAEVVKGAIAAINENKDVKVVLAGKREELTKLLENEDYDKGSVEILGAEDVVTCEEAPTEAVRRKPESSLVKGLKSLKEDGEASAFVSAGSTGAVLTGAVLIVGRIKGVVRPALAPLLPNMKGGETMLLDSGATPDCKSINLVQFALMGKVYMREVKKIAEPKIALLCNGTEDQKGNALTKEAFAALKAVKGLNFVGNMEARDIMSGDYDVVVADGFSGNIALKSIEGAAGCLFASIKKEVKASKKRPSEHF